MFAAFLALALLARAEAGVAFRSVADVDGEAVTLGSVADLGQLPAALRERAAPLVVARLAAGSEVRLSTRRIAERARGQLPALGSWLADEPDAAVVVRRAATSPADAASPARSCVRMVQAVAAADFIGQGDIEPAACPEGVSTRALRFDPATKLVRAAQPLAEGQILAAPPRALVARYPGGQAFTLSAAVGPVRAERPVTAVRPAGAGARVVVRDAEGRIHIVPPPTEALP